MTGDEQPGLAQKPPKVLSPLNRDDFEAHLAEFTERATQAELGSVAQAIQSNPDLRAFFGAVFTLSPYLRDIAFQNPGFINDCLETSFQNVLEQNKSTVSQLGMTTENEAGLLHDLRRAKKKLALACGLADLGGWWEPQQVTAALADFADASLGATFDFLLTKMAQSGKIELADPDRPQYQSGFIVLGMGKHGARELNYSSDIDIILFFDDRAQIKLNTDDPTTLFGRMVKQLVRIMQERTGDGYVFRTDLRLRPDPGSTPPVIPLVTALNYYEAYGQNWERAALIKARPVAGDIEAGKSCLKELAPFVWRKYLDYAAIQDVHSIKRQIHSHKGHGEIAVNGHNIKLGRGGIREIEFFAQTQQLIAGGRVMELRQLRTLDALQVLCDLDWIGEKARVELSKAYWYLRNVEHRLQMVSDEQTHTLPVDEEELLRIALMMGYDDVAAFSKELIAILKTVESHYADLFEAEPELSATRGLERSATRHSGHNASHGLYG